MNLTETSNGSVSCALNAGVVELLHNLIFTNRLEPVVSARSRILSTLAFSARRTRQFELRTDYIAYLLNNQSDELELC